MFSRNKQPAIKSLIAQGTRIEGDVHFVDGLRIDGEVRGDVRAQGGQSGLLVISALARVEDALKAAAIAPDAVSLEGASIRARFGSTDVQLNAKDAIQKALARVDGAVHAAHVIVNGEVVGPVHATELLELQPKARITGDVHYKALEMHQGATICGTMTPTDAVLEEKPPLKLASSAQ